MVVQILLSEIQHLKISSDGTVLQPMRVTALVKREDIVNQQDATSNADDNAARCHVEG